LRLDDARELNAKAAEAARLVTALANRHRDAAYDANWLYQTTDSDGPHVVAGE
jgi:hypothetical protein